MPTATPKENPEPTGVRLRTATGLVVAAALCSGLIFVMIGPGDPPSLRAVSAISVWIGAGWMPLAYLTGAAGWGVLGARLIGSGQGLHAADLATLGMAIGIGASLTATHLLGVFGILTPASAWLWTGVGLCLAAFAMKRHCASRADAAARRVDPWVLGLLVLGAGGVGVMLAASAVPPGAQWDSEFGGYDSLSYHLQLPAEWMDAGRITPLEHNVYSYLPGYMEAATVHMAHLAGTPARDANGRWGLVSGDAEGLIAPNLLSMLMAIVAAWIIARVTHAWLERSGVTGRSAQRSAVAAAALSLLTPWTQVVGSMAYNETGVVALGAAALLASVITGLSPVKRGLLVGTLMGAACGCKPTAILFLAPACAISMLAITPMTSWPRMIAGGVVAGLLLLSPWLTRNALHGGNPVFPQATSLFGSAHWSPDQVATYHAGHTEESVWPARLMMLVTPDPETPADAPTVARYRGLTNPQWALTPWLGIAGGAFLCLARPTRRIGSLALGGILLGLLAWLITTHLQSRFLIPLMPMFACGFGVALGGLPIGARTARSLGLLASVISLVWSGFNFASQRGWRPNELLVVGAGAFSGSVDLGATSDAIPSASINRDPAVRGTVLFIGDSAPLYSRTPIRYATVWDANPMTEAMRAAPDDADAWADSLSRSGVRWVYVSFAELARLTRSGWNDPMLTTDRVLAFAAWLGEPYRTWPDSGSALYRVPPTTPDEPNEP